MSRRATRRILVVVAVVLLLVGGVFGLRTYRGMQQAAQFSADRADGLERYAAGDFGGALRPLSRAVNADETDLEALRAFADARGRVPTGDGTHIVEALDLHSALRDRAVLIGELQVARAARWEIARFAVAARRWDVLGRACEELSADSLSGDEQIKWLNAMARLTRASPESPAVARLLAQVEQVAAAWALADRLGAFSPDVGGDRAGASVDDWSDAELTIVAPLAIQLALLESSPDPAVSLVQIAAFADSMIDGLDAETLGHELRELSASSRIDAGSLDLVTSVISIQSRDVSAGEWASEMDRIRSAVPAPRRYSTALVVSSLLRTLERGIGSGLVGRPEDSVGSRRLADEFELVREVRSQLLSNLSEPAADRPLWHALVVARDHLQEGDHDAALEELSPVFNGQMPEDDPELLAELSRFAGIAALMGSSRDVARSHGRRLVQVARSISAPELRDLETAWGDAIVELAGPETDVPSQSEVPELLGRVKMAAAAPSLIGIPRPDLAAAGFLRGAEFSRRGELLLSIREFEFARLIDATWLSPARALIQAYSQTQRTRDAFRVALDRRWWSQRRPVHTLLLARAWARVGALEGGRTISFGGRTWTRSEFIRETFSLPDSWSREGTQLLLESLMWDLGRDGLIAYANEVLIAARAGAEASSSGVAACLDRVATEVGRFDRELAQQLLDSVADSDLDRASSWRIAARRAVMDGREIPVPPSALEIPADELWAIRLSGLFGRIQRGDDVAVDAAADLLRVASSANRVRALLRDQAIWSHRSLARAAIERLETLAGPDSLVVRAARVRESLEFLPEERVAREAAIAGVLQGVEGLLLTAPNDPELLAIKARVLADELGATDRAARTAGLGALRELIEVNPGDVDARIRVVEILQDEGRWAEAEESLEELERRVGTMPSVVVRLARLMDRAARTQNAIDLVEASNVALNSVDTIWFAAALTRLGRADDAMAVTEDVARRFGTAAGGGLSRSQWVELAVVRAGIVGDDTAEEWLEKQGAGLAESERLTTLAIFNLVRLRAKRAGDLARAAVAADPRSGDAVACLIFSEIELGAAPGDLRDLRDRLVADSLERTPLLDQAESIADGIEGGGRQSTIAIARSAVGQGRAVDPSTISALRDIVQDSPSGTEERGLLVSALELSGDRVGALLVAVEGMRRVRADASIAARAANLALELARPDVGLEAVAAWRQRTNDTDPNALIVHAELMASDGRPDRGYELIRTASDVAVERIAAGDTRPADPSVVLTAIRMSAISSHPSLPDLIGRATEVGFDPITVAGVAIRGGVHVVAPLLDSALRDSVEVSSRREDGLRRLEVARLRSELDRWHRAPEQLERARSEIQGLLDSGGFAERSIEREAAVSLAATLDHAAGDVTSAITRWRSLISGDSSLDIGERNNLAFLLAASGEDCREAVELAQSALEAQSSLPERSSGIRAVILGTSALALSCVGENDLAVMRARESTELVRPTPGRLLILAICLHRSGDTSGALSAFRSAQESRSAPGQAARDSDFSLLEVLWERITVGR